VARVMGQAAELVVRAVRPKVGQRAVKPCRERLAGSYDADVHAPSRANDGRPPPTTVWAADKPPQVREAERIDHGRVRKGTRGKRRDWKGGEAWSDVEELGSDGSDDDWYG